jgi:F-type H+-transporting ATPase subunit gamma
LNINLFKAAIQSMKAQQEEGVEVDLCLVGAKAGGFFASVGGNVTATVRDLGEEPALEHLIGGVKTMLDAYTEGRIDALFLAGNEFVNTMTQAPRVEQLLPLKAEDNPALSRIIGIIFTSPTRESFWMALMVRYIESLVYQAVVENGACEQAARMIAMKNATDNAGELIDELQLVYNKARQAAITQELSEIVGGAAAIG